MTNVKGAQHEAPSTQDGLGDMAMRIVELFDKDPTAYEFLREDGEGGFSGAVFRMAREIERLRASPAQHEAMAPAGVQNQQGENPTTMPPEGFHFTGSSPHHLAPNAPSVLQSDADVAREIMVNVQETYGDTNKSCLEREAATLIAQHVAARLAEAQKVIDAKSAQAGFEAGLDAGTARTKPLVEALEAMKGDYLDDIIGCQGTGPEFQAYNRGKSAMADWFLRRIDLALAQEKGLRDG